MRTHRFGKKLKLPATIAIKTSAQDIDVSRFIGKGRKGRARAEATRRPARAVEPRRGGGVTPRLDARAEERVRIGAEDSEFAAHSDSISPAQAPGSTQ
jgi:hypothetical protein